MGKQFRARLWAWWQRIFQGAKDTWVLWVLGELLEDRIMGGINSTLDSFSSGHEWVSTLKYAIQALDTYGLGFIGNIFAFVFLVLIIHAYFATHRHQEHLPRVPEVLPTEEDILKSYFYKEQLLLFVGGEMEMACHDMLWTMHHVNEQLGEKGGAHRYYARALSHFMEPLEEARTRLDSFLSERNPLSNNDFIEAQKQCAQLYRIYEARMPWVRDLVWYTKPNPHISLFYENWKDADGRMREALKTLLPSYPVLSEQIPEPSSLDPWWWEKTPPS